MRGVFYVSLRKKKRIDQLILNIFFVLFSMSFILPLFLIISASMADQNSLKNFGYTFFPYSFDFTAYKYLFSNPKQIFDSYKVTGFISVFGTLISVFVMALTAYPLSRSTFKLRKQITFFIFFTMLFGGGLVPTYILITQYLGMGNTIWVYIFPSLCSVWHIIIIRTFFQGLPVSLIESAKIDGASETRIFLTIILPLSKPVIATISLFVLLGKWNDWFTSLIYIRENSLYTLQFLLQRILRDAQFVKEMTQDIPQGISNDAVANIPTDSIRYAMVIITSGPMLVIFPFFQKYFARGLTIGAVKG